MSVLNAEKVAKDFGFNLLDTNCFAKGHPHEAYDKMREYGKIIRHDGNGFRAPFWVMTTHDIIKKTSLDNEVFTSTRGFRIPTQKRGSMDPEITKVLSRFMLTMDNPEHLQYRNLVAANFTPAALKNVEPIITAAVEKLMQNLGDRDEVEFVTEVGAIVPIKTVCALMGVPPEDEGKVFNFTNAVFGTDDPDFSPDIEAANQNYLKIYDYAMWLYNQKKQNPADDLMSKLAYAEIDGRPLNDTEIKSYFSNMVAAGNETTRSSFSGAIWALSKFRDERNKIINDFSLMPKAVDEILRWFSPVFHMARTAKQDFQLENAEVREGENIVFLYGAANHDPAVFSNPHQLDIMRPNAKDGITFGSGVHHCLGFRLGNMQLRIILETFLKHYPNYEILHEPIYVASNFVGAMKELRVKLR